MKLSVEDIQSIIKETVTDPTDCEAALSAIEKLIAETATSQKSPTEKKKLMAVQLEDPDSVYIVQGSESFKEETLIDLIRTKIAPNFNTSPKGSKHPVGNLAEVFEFVAKKFFDDYDISIKTKTPINIIHSENSKI
jgi:hypothetical protein